MKRRSARRRSSKSSVSFISKKYIVIGIIGLTLFLITSQNQDNVLGVKFLAQETTPNSTEGAPPSDQPPPQQPESQPQQAAPQEQQQVSPQTQQQYQPMSQEQMQQQMQQMQQMTPEQQRQYGIQQMNPEQREQNRLYEQMSPQQQQEYNKKINEQIQQRYGGQTGQSQTQTGSTQQPNTSGNNSTQPTGTSAQTSNQSISTNNNPYQPSQQQLEQMRQQAQQYQQMTPEQKRQFDQQMQQQAQRQYQQLQQQWQQEATKNGFRVSINEQMQKQYQEYVQQGINPLGTTPTNTNNATPNPISTQGFSVLPPPTAFPNITGNFFVNSTGNPGSPRSVNLNDQNTRVQLTPSSLKAINEDGTQVEIDQSALEQITAAIKLETGSEIIQNNDSFTMKRGNVEASTTLPISFNVATKTFTVETPDGEQELKVLPDEAVQMVLASNEITDLTTTGSTAPVVITEFNNQPVYQIEGTNTKRMLGFFPIAIPKTTFISAQNGDVISSSQNVPSRILSIISF